ncbi:uncharacterized protein LOC106643111 [Copidosoma floridanum]|uniref:uncharacterized protein LOC106643111 n=1 Tax=Copidosoma floridanum TaxID=29053 RepID=UPI0006C98654|nr:uncharacterized protein LOC106643111 [Copidosoma floridanum]
MAFEVFHNLLHPDIKSTARLVSEKFMWPKLQKEGVIHWAQWHSRSALGDFIVSAHLRLPAEAPLDQRLPVVTHSDRFIRWPIAAPTLDQQDTTVTKALHDNWIAIFRTPLTITSDQRAQFESVLFTELAKIIDSSHIRTTPYNNQYFEVNDMMTQELCLDICQTCKLN